MATLANSAEGGTNTTLVSGANSGGSSGDAWSSVNRTSAASAYTFSSSFPAHGSLGYAIQAASGEACQLIWTVAGTNGAAALFYYRHPGTPSAASQLATIRHGSGNMAIMSVGTDNKLILQNAVGGNIRVSPTALVAGDEVWISFRALKGGSTSTGTVEYAWGYKGSATVQDTGISTATNAGTADPASYRFGRTTGSTWATTMHYDSIEVETAATALIPSLEQRNLAFSLAMSGDGTVALDKTQTMVAALATSGSGTVETVAVPTLTADLATSGSGTVTLSSVPNLIVALAMSGAGELTLEFESGSTDIEYDLEMSSTGTLGISTTVTMVAGLAPSGSGTVTVSATPSVGHALALSGSGELVLDETTTLLVELAVSGTGTLTLALAVDGDTRPGRRLAVEIPYATAAEATPHTTHASATPLTPRTATPVED